MAYTTTELLAKIKLWGAVPASQPAFNATQLLDMATDELQTNIVSFINSLREDYFVVYEDTAITGVATQTFNIPSRAAGGLLRDVKLVNSDGDESDIPRVNPEYSQRESWGFYILANTLYLVEAQDYSSYNMRLYYYVRPSVLVETTSCAQVSSVGSTTFDVTSIPTNLTTGDTVDIVQAKAPFNTLSLGITATWTGTTVTPSVMPTGLTIGDWMCVENESCIPQVQLETHPLLAQATVIHIQEILQDSKGIKTARDRYEEMAKSITNILTPRVVGEVKKIKNYESFLNYHNDRQRYWYL